MKFFIISLHWYDICLNRLLISSIVLFFVSGTLFHINNAKNNCNKANTINTEPPINCCNGKNPTVTIKFAVQLIAIAIDVAAGLADEFDS